MEQIEFVTARFLLREIETEDAEILHTIWSDVDVTRYMATRFDDVDETIAMISLLNDLAWQEMGIRWVIIDKSTGQILGTCGFHNVNKEHQRAEIGYEIGCQHWGKGVMQEVLGPVFDYCFYTQGFNRLEAFVTSGNQRSLDTLKRLGFTKEGYLRQYEFNQGNFQDQYILSLLKCDWESQCR